MSVLDRVTAACAFASSAVGSDHHQWASEKQKDKMVAMMCEEEISPAIVPQMLQLFQQGMFAAPHLQELHTCLDNAASMFQGSSLTSKTQNFENFTSFLTPSQWRRLKVQDGHEEPMHVMIEILDSLGCRNPCELTSRTVTACLILCTEDPEKIRGISSQAMKSIFLATKKALSKGLNGKGMPPFRHLPPKPSQLQAMYEPIYDRLYAIEGPTKSPFSPGDYEYLISNIRCRGAAKSAPMQLQVQQPAGLAELGNGVMQMMQQLVANQQAMMQQMANPQQTASLQMGNFPRLPDLTSAPKIIGDRLALETVPTALSPLKIEAPKFALDAPAETSDTAPIEEHTPVKCTKLASIEEHTPAKCTDATQGVARKRLNEKTTESKSKALKSSGKDSPP